uniref:Uncharacterized protein n=1 Tax=Panagrolaimus sp. ES5 TaxID=591445 RepID=A0AC34G5Y1_9BILA
MKAEQKEKEKRQKERQRNLELQREKIHKAASEDAAAMQATTASDANFFVNQPISKTKQRHSVHATAFNNHLMPMHSHELHHREKIEVPHRSPSTDCGKPGDPNHPQSQSNGGGSRFMKWLGFSPSPQNNTNGVSRKEQRRMSTF